MLAMLLISAFMSAVGDAARRDGFVVFSPQAAKWISFLLLMGLGLWMIFDSFREEARNTAEKRGERGKTFEFMLKSIGLSVKNY